MNVLLAIVTKWEDMGCTLGNTPGYLLLPRTHEAQKPSVSQGLYPILLVALLASTASAYTSLGVSHDSNPQCQLLKGTVYHSATSAVHCKEVGRVPQEFLPDFLLSRKFLRECPLPKIKNLGGEMARPRTCFKA
jgi:hypothetical protein